MATNSDKAVFKRSGAKSGKRKSSDLHEAEHHVEPSKKSKETISELEVPTTIAETEKRPAIRRSFRMTRNLRDARDSIGNSVSDYDSLNSSGNAQPGASNSSTTKFDHLPPTDRNRGKKQVAKSSVHQIGLRSRNVKLGASNEENLRARGKNSRNKRVLDEDSSDEDIDTTMKTDSKCQPRKTHKRRSSRNRREASREINLRIVDCGVRGNGTVCRCVSDRLKFVYKKRRNSTQNISSVLINQRDFDEVRSTTECEESVFQSDSDTEVNRVVRPDLSDPESMYNTSFEDIDGDLAINSAPTSRLHRCTSSCAVGCRGSQRPSEIVIFEGKSFNRLLKAGETVSMEKPICVDFRPFLFKKVGGRGAKKPCSIKRSPSWILNENTGLFCNDTVLPQRVALILDRPAVSKTEAMKHAWNPQDRSFNIRMDESDPFTIMRQPVAQSTDSARTLIGYSSGVHVFEVIWPLRQRGTHAVVGVATDKQSLHSVGYSSLVGLTEESWGWDLSRLKAFHNSIVTEGKDYPATRDEDFFVKKNFFLVMDCDAGTLGFSQAGKWLGVAHSNLKGHTLYPIVSSVWGHCEITLRYHGGEDGGQPPALTDLCRLQIREVCTKLKTLPIPTSLKTFINHGKPCKT